MESIKEKGRGKEKALIRPWSALPNFEDNKMSGKKIGPCHNNRPNSPPFKSS
jgi:hypothetical protein